MYWFHLKITFLDHMVSSVTTAQATQGKRWPEVENHYLQMSYLTTNSYQKIPTAQQGNSGSTSPLSMKNAYFPKMTTVLIQWHFISGALLGPSTTVRKKFHSEAENQKQITTTTPLLPPKYSPPGVGRCVTPQGSLNCGKETPR